ncbi:MAG TPA: glycosyltransferase, partial [Gemmatimonadales bacterium]|nr:glycosyltransferase [Gemmatimonadales bacterium]
EEPIHAPAAAPHWERSRPQTNVLVCRPVTPVAAPGFDARQLPVLRPLLRELRESAELQDVVAWLYTPMAVPLARLLAPRAVVYDVMDELSLFLGAPPELVERERELLGWADLVFTGGPSLHRAKRDRHPSVHCFPSSVDAAHFARARADAPDRPPEPADQAPLPRPRLGFFGVLDERLDLAVLDTLARRRPDWQLVMVGPVVKIDPATLPRHPNIHYLGQRDYRALPGYLAGWDVCLLPFARNDATRYISPTKTLEYMAAERPIVSTGIRDVAEPYGGIVHLADAPADFVAACGRALAEVGTEAHRRRVAAMRDVLARTSWDDTAAAMERLVAGVLQRRTVRRPHPVEA